MQLLNLFPRSMPDLMLMLDDLGNPSSEQLAKALRVSERTVRRWIARGEAPIPAAMTIYWVTSWGQAELVAEAAFGIDVYRELARSLHDECEDLRRKLASLGGIGEFGSANDPLPGVVAGSPAEGLAVPDTAAPLANHKAGDAARPGESIDEPPGVTATSSQITGGKPIEPVRLPKQA